MLAGLVFTAGYITWFKLMRPELNVEANWLLGISPEGIGALGMVLNFAVAIAVATFTRPTPPEVRELVEAIRIPRGAGAASGH
jgi:cation/acetate symporter